MPMHDWTRVRPNIYHTFHQAWITSLWHALNTGILPAGYYALADQSTPSTAPDVLTLQVPSPGGAAAGGGGTAVAAAPPRVRFTATGRGPRRRRAQPQVRIRHSSNHRLVAVIEIVSPANKRGGRDFRLFVDKAVEYLLQGVNLLVVDPFPPTRRDPRGVHAAIWRSLTRGAFAPPADKPLTLASYVDDGANQYTAYVEPVAVGDALPDMPVFLDDETYVNVPLEPTYLAAWAGFPSPWRGVVAGAATA